MIFSLFLLFSGHNNPGGGFAGGMLAGIALIVRYLAGGRYELALATRIRPGAILGIGMTLATTAALAPIPFGGTVLQTTVFDLVLPVFNEVHLATALFFDVGVYLIVIGLVLDILSSLGAEVDRQAEAEGTSPPDLAHDEHVRSGVMRYQRARELVAATADPALDVGLPGLVPSRRQPQMGADGAGLREAVRIIDGGAEGERRDRSDVNRHGIGTPDRLPKGALAHSRCSLPV